MKVAWRFWCKQTYPEVQPYCILRNLGLELPVVQSGDPSWSKGKINHAMAVCCWTYGTFFSGILRIAGFRLRGSMCLMKVIFGVIPSHDNQLQWCRMYIWMRSLHTSTASACLSPDSYLVILAPLSAAGVRGWFSWKFLCRSLRWVSYLWDSWAI